MSARLLHNIDRRSPRLSQGASIPTPAKNGVVVNGTKQGGAIYWEILHYDDVNHHRDSSLRRKYPLRFKNAVQEHSVGS